jgi:hypothetical protein
MPSTGASDCNVFAVDDLSMHTIRYILCLRATGAVPRGPHSRHDHAHHSSGAGVLRGEHNAAADPFANSAIYATLRRGVV